MIKFESFPSTLLPECQKHVTQTYTNSWLSWRTHTRTHIHRQRETMWQVKFIDVLRGSLPQFKPFKNHWITKSWSIVIIDCRSRSSFCDMVHKNIHFYFCAEATGGTDHISSSSVISSSSPVLFVNLSVSWRAASLNLRSSRKNFEYIKTKRKVCWRADRFFNSIAIIYWHPSFFTCSYEWIIEELWTQLVDSYLP